MKVNILKIRPKPGQGVYVFQFPVRLWHWVMAACIFTLFVTGYFIGSPPQSVRGDATDLFCFGLIIRTHYIAGLILCVFMLWRICFAFYGNVVSRQIFFPHIWDKSWWRNFWDNVLWYLFIKKKGDINIGHNALAQAAMFVVVMTIIFMCVSGLGIFQAKGYSSFFSMFNFMEDLAYASGGNGIDLVLWHRMGMIIVVAFVMCHVYMVIREEIMGRTTLISTMINGTRLVKATLKEDWQDLKEEQTGLERD